MRTKNRVDLSSLDQAATFAVLLLHGLYAHADELKPIAEMLTKQFGKAIFIMQPTCRTGLKSLLQSIDQQAARMLQWIELELIRCHKNPISFPIIIIGYSQGGVLACTLGRLYKSQLNILGIITLNAPLMGTPLLERTGKDMQKFISDGAAGLQLIDYPLVRIKWISMVAAWVYTLARLSWAPVNGLKDIAPNSRCLKGIYTFLQDNVDIPCLLIGTYQNDLLSLFNTDIKTTKDHESIAQLNDAYALFISGKKGAKHDTLIPLASQLWKEENVHTPIPLDTKNLDHTYLPIVGSNHPPIKRKIYKGLLHARNLIAIDPNLFVNHCETVLYAHSIQADLIQYIKGLVQNAGKVVKK
ncbi:hypothetical protein [Cardinium endosymbiont of Bemisia tabaci]|uniref:alpha/beta hydrolase n=1 Tax=Cardinium endosymbiont of Bemisia tabaci TaxID=672794 RepID=UPI000442D2E1|nr:hypothetical protein [Cardinium endosymbiont of Bemisia tabaci]CDG49876.1 Alpha/beta hydrolase family protein [Cardinium endosymbiont cBtQ1 of Bemisia tabaci]